MFKEYPLKYVTFKNIRKNKSFHNVGKHVL
jgi:hypothetical protein